MRVGQHVLATTSALAARRRRPHAMLLAEDASCRALTASLPVKRVTIFCLKARENGFVTESLPSRPAD